MCVGVPMRVLSVAGLRAHCQGCGDQRWVRVELVAPVSPGDWLLVFLDCAREVISAQRAAEVEATLALVEAALGGRAVAGQELAFELPSATSQADLSRLAGTSFSRSGS